MWPVHASQPLLSLVKPKHTVLSISLAFVWLNLVLSVKGCQLQIWTVVPVSVFHRLATGNWTVLGNFCVQRLCRDGRYFLHVCVSCALVHVGVVIALQRWSRRCGPINTASLQVTFICQNNWTQNLQWLQFKCCLLPVTLVIWLLVCFWRRQKR